MKITIFALACIIALALSASLNQTISNLSLVSGTTTNFTLSVSTTALTDAGVGTYTVTVASTISAAGTAIRYDAVACANTGTTSYSLSANASSLKIFAAEASTGTDASTATAWGYDQTGGTAATFLVYAGAAGTYTSSSTTYATGAITSQASVGTHTKTAGSATTYSLAISALSEANRNTIGLPMSNETGYYVCFSQLNAGTSSVINTSGENLDTAASWTAANNVTVGAYGAAAIAGFAATLAYAF